MFLKFTQRFYDTLLVGLIIAALSLTTYVSFKLYHENNELLIEIVEVKYNSKLMYNIMKDEYTMLLRACEAEENREN